MTIEQIIFYVMASITLGSALYVALSANLVRSIFMFFLTLFSLAGLYVFALADFVAITQVVIYVGGVLVLMLFAFLLSNKALLNDLKKHTTGLITFHNLPAFLVAAIFLIVLVNGTLKSGIDQLSWINAAGSNTFQPTDYTIQNIGINLMTRYLLPFEVISILLLMALIGAAHLARKEKKE
ncbi:MAG: NADH-quinone oxidoreductase subunit J [Sphingobacteriaceae bacterium]